MRPMGRLLRYLPLFFGLTGFLAFLTYGLVSRQLLPPGIVPLAGIIISVLLVLSNLWHLVPERLRRPYSWALLLVYTVGVLVMGLRPKGSYDFAPIGVLPVLEVYVSSAYDVTMNVVGFIPLGFLVFLACSMSGRLRTDVFRFFAATAACALISLFIELAQHVIVSRSSSLVDLLTNVSGGLIGAAYGLLHVRLWSGSDTAGYPQNPSRADRGGSTVCDVGAEA